MIPQSGHDAEMDARTLAEAEAIKANSARMIAASGMAKQLQKDSLARAAEYGKLTTGGYDHPDSVAARQERGEQV